MSRPRKTKDLARRTAVDAGEANRREKSSESFDEILAVLAAASRGELTARVAIPDDPKLDDTTTRLALAVNTLLEASALRASDARRELSERERLANRLRTLAEASHEFSATTYDVDRLLDAVARRLGELVGDMCAIRAISDDGEWLESTGAAYHRDPELMAATREAMSSGRQRVGDGVSGRVAATGQPLVTPKIDSAAFAAASAPKYRSFLERIGVASSMTLPLMCRGKVVGVANLLRSSPDHPYGEDELRLAQSIADHAALAIGNARSAAAERAARDAAETATRARTQAESRFARLSDSGIIGIIVADLSGRVLEANDTLLDWVGYSREELLSGSVACSALTPLEWLDVDTRAVEQLTTYGIAGLREKEYLRKSGTRVPVLIGSAMLDGKADAQECISFVLDLTERRATQAAIERLREERASDIKFRGLLEAAPDAMVIVGSDGAVVLVNGQAERLFGYTRKEIVGRPIETFIPARFLHSHPSQRDGYFLNPEIRSMGTVRELYGRRKDGAEFPIEVSLSPLLTEEGLLVSAAIRDITDRKKTDLQRARLAAIVDSSADAIIGKALDGVITSWNRGAEGIFGYTADEVVGRSISVLLPPGHEHGESMMLDALARGEVKQFDTVRRRKDGRDIDVSVTISPVRDVAGQVCGISNVARDITDRKRAEVALAQAKDVAEAASRELEAFSYSVAHDLRAPLRGMNGFAHVLLDEYGDKFDAEGQDWLREILLNAQKMGALIDALLALSRLTRSEMRRELIDVSAVVRAVVAQLRVDEPQRVVETVIQEHLRADLDPALARALIENLVGNAWKFTSKVPAARIEFGATEGDGSLVFFVRDNGAGFDMAFADKLFTPFQRLHTVDEFPGTGIGLATAQRIVHRHGGRIWAEGAIEHGSSFYFTFSAPTSRIPAPASAKTP